MAGAVTGEVTRMPQGRPRPSPRPRAPWRSTDRRRRPRAGVARSRAFVRLDVRPTWRPFARQIHHGREVVLEASASSSGHGVASRACASRAPILRSVPATSAQSPKLNRATANGRAWSSPANGRLRSPNAGSVIAASKLSSSSVHRRAVPPAPAVELDLERLLAQVREPELRAAVVPPGERAAARDRSSQLRSGAPAAAARRG